MRPSPSTDHAGRFDQRRGFYNNKGRDIWEGKTTCTVTNKRWRSWSGAVHSYLLGCVAFLHGLSILLHTLRFIVDRWLRPSRVCTLAASPQTTTSCTTARSPVALTSSDKVRVVWRKCLGGNPAMPHPLLWAGSLRNLEANTVLQ